MGQSKPRIRHMETFSPGSHYEANTIDLGENYAPQRQCRPPLTSPQSENVLHLWREDLPEFDGDKAAAKMTFFRVGEMDNARQSAWGQIEAITERFARADAYVLSVPMWNGGVPYKLKQYIDIITQPGLLFPSRPFR